MLNISIICVGKLKEKYWSLAVLEYLKRLKAFCKCTIVEIDEKKVSANPSDFEIKEAICTEGKRILSKIPNNSYVISMCIEGKELSSEQFAKKIEEIPLNGKSSIAIIIGGSWGLSSDVKERSDFKLSISKMTFPHQMARVILLEQVYRAFQILSDGKYHK